RKLTSELEELCAQYEKEYNAPISAASAANMDGGWQWVKQPWPWEEEV
ncbi:MAG: spore coat protein CotJB, partial [Eubacteriales bacterium]